MGLDMYLKGKRYLHDYSSFDCPTRRAVNDAFTGTPLHGKINEVSAEIAYWRKANAIHNWFVTNCQGGRDECQLSYVSHENLTTLRDLCREVLASKCAEKLPPTSGFFFGSTDVDDGYFGDLQYTADTLSEIVDNPGTYKDWDFFYQASW